MKMWKLFPVAVSFIILFGCHKKSTLSSKRDPNAFLKISFQNDPRSLNPRIGIDCPSSFAIKMLFEGLMRMGINGQAEPAIARSYTISKDQKTYTFYLRDTIWSNGDPVTADDFAYSWKKVINPNDGESLGVQNLYPIKNVRAVVRGEKPIDSVGIQVINKKTLQVELEYPTPYFLEVLSTTSLLPINAHFDRENPNWANRDGPAFVCNGPFTLKRHRIENEIIVEKNPSYWDKEHVQLPGIEIAIVKDAMTQVNLFEKGEIEWLGNPLFKLPLDAVTHLKEREKIRFYKSLGTYWFFINVESFPFNNKNMRKAFAYAVNRKELTEHVTQCQETPATGILPYELATQKEPFFQDNNIELALKYFDQALEEMHLTKESLPKITIHYSDNPVHREVAAILQQQWSKALNIDIALEKQDWKVYYGTLQKGNYQLGGMYWISWLRDPIYIMQTFRDKSDGVNMSQWENRQYQELLSAAEQEIDPIKRKHYFNQAETLLIEEMPMIPIFFASFAYGKNNSLKNVYLSDLFEVDFRWAYFEDN